MKKCISFFAMFMLLIFQGCNVDNGFNSDLEDVKKRSLQIDCNVTGDFDAFTRMLEEGEYENLFNAIGITDYAPFVDEIVHLANQIKASGLDPYLTDLVNSGHITTHVKSFMIQLASIEYICSDAECILTELENLQGLIRSSPNLDITEKNNLTTPISLMISIGELKYCDTQSASTRGFEDDQYCGPGGADINLADACGRKTFILGGFLGALIGVAIIIVAPAVGIIIAAKAHGVIVAGSFIAGAIATSLVNPANCSSQVCDDCQHPSEYKLIYDYAACRITQIRAVGAFEFAEEWEWKVETISGEILNATTSIPRLDMPSSFNINREAFSVRGWTVCDGGLYPATVIVTNTDATIEQNAEGTSQNFQYILPPHPWILVGNTTVDDFGVFRFETTPTVSNLVNPVWTVGQATIVNQGFVNDKYFIELSFGNISNSEQVITLTLKDSCTGAVITKTLNLKVENV